MNYREEVLRTANPLLTKDDMILNGAMGLAGETGETVDLIKKFKFHGKPFDRDKLIKELGDVRWYLELLSIAIDISMEDIEQLNIQKLKERYPNGFNPQDSELRRDTQNNGKI